MSRFHLLANGPEWDGIQVFPEWKRRCAGVQDDSRKRPTLGDIVAEPCEILEIIFPDI